MKSWTFCNVTLALVLKTYGNSKKGPYKYIFGTLQQIPVNMYVFSYGYLWTGSIYLCLIWSDRILTQVPLLHR